MKDELKTNLASALIKFQSEVPVIPKNKTAKIKTKAGYDYSYNYADLADIWEAIRQPLKDNGLAVTQFLKSSDTTDFIVTKIWFNNGETESEEFALPTSGKTPQEVGSVITYYKRYALGAALGISTEEDDDAKSGNTKPEPKKTPVKTTYKSPQEDNIRSMGKSLGYSDAIMDAKISTIMNEDQATEMINKLSELIFKKDM
jgi:hypothetical protein